MVTTDATATALVWGRSGPVDAVAVVIGSYPGTHG